MDSPPASSSKPDSFKVCKVPDCGMRARSNGYCPKHMSRWRRHGDPLIAHRMIPRGTPVAQRIEMLSGPPNENGCRLWTGTIHHGKYGVLTVEGVTKSAHVWSWEVANGRKVTPGLFVLHSCDVCACVEPSHLREGTHQDNMNDKVERRRCAAMHGEANPMAKLTRSDAEAIRSQYAAGGHTHGSLARLYGVSASQVGFILAGKRWAT